MKTAKSKMDYIREVTGYIQSVAAMPVEEANGYVLCWPGVNADSPLFVGFGADRKPYAGGLQTAKVYPTMAACPNNVMNGRSEAAEPIALPEAQLMCLRSQAGLLRTLCELSSSLVDPATAFAKPKYDALRIKTGEVIKAGEKLRARGGKSFTYSHCNDKGLIVVHESLVAMRPGDLGDVMVRDAKK